MRGSGTGVSLTASGACRGVCQVHVIPTTPHRQLEIGPIAVIPTVLHYEVEW